ncbi:MAG: tetratricopeptide repeat protein, partial [Mariprofundus sp.]|nr:tetratricopeptide repeat protein [Mariprofundus sp.]
RMAQWNFAIESNPHVNIVVDDAIHYVKAGAERYSLILNTVTTPLYFSSSKLYTKNFFDDVKGRLKRDGVYVTWMDSRIGDAGSDIILRSLQKSFKHCAVLYVKSAYFLLIASDQPLTMAQQQAVISQPQLRENLMAKHDIMSEWLPYHLMTTDAFSLIGNSEGVVNTADYPALEFEIASLQESGIPAFKKRLRAHFDMTEIEQALPELSASFPADLLAQVHERLGNASITRRWERLLRHKQLDHKKELAELELRKARRDVKKRVRDMHAYAYQLMKLDRYAEAITVFKTVLQKEPAHDNAYYNLGVSYEVLGENELALNSFNHELAIDPEDQDASFRIGRLQVKLHRYEQALLNLNEYIKTYGKNRRKAYFYRALSNRALGHDARAEADVMQAMRLGEKEKVMAEQLELLK